MEQRYERTGKTLRCFMPKELDQHIAKILCEEIDRMIEHYGIRELVFDFTKTEFMDSSGIGVLIGRSRTMQYHEGIVNACNMLPRVKRMFEAAGLHRIIHIKED